MTTTTTTTTIRDRLAEMLEFYDAAVADGIEADVWLEEELKDIGLGLLLSPALTDPEHGYLRDE